MLNAAFGRWPLGIDSVMPQEFFRWKHMDGPIGSSKMLVVECAGEVTGFAAYMPWRFRAGGRELQAARAVDYAVHPEHQRSGVSMAIRAAVSLAPQTAFIWSNPNAQSRVGGLRSGRRQVTTLARYLRLNPHPTAAALASGGRRRARRSRELDIQAETAGDFLRDDARASALAVAGEPAALSTVHDPGYLGWRYGRFADYRVVERTGAGRDAAIFRVRRHGRLLVSHVCELFVERGDSRATRKLLAQVAKAAPADLISCHFASRRHAAVHGFLPYRAHTALMAYRLHERVAPDPTRRSSWRLSLGDLELL